MQISKMKPTQSLQILQFWKWWLWMQFIIFVWQTIRLLMDSGSTDHVMCMQRSVVGRDDMVRASRLEITSYTEIDCCTWLRTLVLVLVVKLLSALLKYTAQHYKLVNGDRTSIEHSCKTSVENLYLVCQVRDMNFRRQYRWRKRRRKATSKR